VKDIIKRVQQNAFLRSDRRFLNSYDLTSVILPLSRGAPFLDILKNTNMLEGDLIRLFRQMMDRIMTLRKATHDEELLKELNAATIAIDACFENIGLI
jgi:superfamily II RNA helicase